MDNLINVINKGLVNLQKIAPFVAMLAIAFQAFRLFKGSGQDRAEAKEAIFWIIVGFVLVFLASSIISTLQSDMGW